MKRMFTVIGVLGVLTLPLSGFAESVPAGEEKVGVVESVYYIKEDRVNGMSGSTGAGMASSMATNPLTFALGAVIGGIAGSIAGDAMKPKTNVEITVVLDSGEKVTVVQSEKFGGFVRGDHVLVKSGDNGMRVIQQEQN